MALAVVVSFVVGVFTGIFFASRSPGNEKHVSEEWLKEHVYDKEGFWPH